MKTYDFINANIGKEVYVTGDGDLAFDGGLRKIISSKHDYKKLTLIKLTKGCKAYLKDEQTNLYYTVPCSNVRLYSEVFELIQPNTLEGKSHNIIY